jgi:phthalate 4,5-dioxygenase oxygenase subunit
MDDGSWLAIGNRRNDYLIDREKQKTESYTGIAFIRAQDSAMTDGMGTIADRSKEHLATTDMGIIRMRRRLIKAARELEEGIEPYAASHPESFAVRSGGCVLPRDVYFTDDAGVWADINVKP